jgi:N-acetylglucosamine-6-phosphate deacetylase
MADLWIARGRLILADGIREGCVGLRGGRIAALRRRAPRGARTISVGGAFVAPGLIDLHVWGDPAVVSRDAARAGTTAFLTTLGPEPPGTLRRHAAERARVRALAGAECLGVHLEGPFVNPARGGALPRAGMRAPTVAELARLQRAARGRIRLVTFAPELRGAQAAIAWCRRHGVVASLGHSIAPARVAREAVAAGARAVTHVFNGMPSLHHREPSLLDVALADQRLTAMVIADGVHVGAAALRLLRRTKGPARVALVTDSIRRQGWDVVKRRGAFYRRTGVLAGSDLTMLGAVQTMVRDAGVSLPEAVAMASTVPARLLGLRGRGQLRVGARADLTVFDGRFRPRLTIVLGHLAYVRG